MVTVIKALQSVLTILVMISVGYYLAHRRWFNEEISELFAKIVIKVSLPAFMISNMLSTFDKESLGQMGLGAVFPIASMTATYIVGAIAARVFKIDPQKRGVFKAMFALSNTIFIGLPVNVALFGEECTPFVLIFYLMNTVFFWTVGVYSIKQDVDEQPKAILDIQNLKKIVSPPLIAFAIGTLLIAAGISLPEFIMSSSKYIGNLTTPLSMLFMGIIIHSIDVRSLRLDKDKIVLMAGRFLISPLLIMLFMANAPIPMLMKKVFIIESAMPVMTQTAIAAQAYGADHKYTTVMATITTVASLAIVPIYMLLISVF
jgi:predicted permease